MFMNENDYRHRLQEVLYTPEDILVRIFRKDGPLLGDQFDPIPSNAFPGGSSSSCLEENHHKRRKVSMHAILDNRTCCESSSHARSHGIGKGPMTENGAPIKKYGMGKGLMMFQRVTNPGARHYRYGAYDNGGIIQKKKKQAQSRESILRKLANRERAKRKAYLRCRKVEPQKTQKQKKPQKEKCDLALEDV